jgi:type III restriction enzyme
MPLRDLEYQARVLERFDEYLVELAAQKARADRIDAVAREDPTLGLRPLDFPAETWRALHAAGKLPPSRAHVPHSPRADGVGRPVPNVVFKVPTGGGKTYLAVASLSRVFGRYLGRSTGFVLWIVPNEAIYRQTLLQLTDRQHPYRQMLDVLSANRVLLMEKTDKLDARDISASLCVMLLMLQSAKRATRDSLKMFQDRGDVHGFFPPEGDQEAHRVMLEEVGSLDAYSASSDVASLWPMVKDSLGNALRLIRPVVVLDEGHKAISELAFETLYGFNPCFVLELTATPKDVAARGGAKPRPARHANVLVELSGLDLDREGMIKLPLNLDPRTGTDWHNTLRVSLERLNVLQAEAQRFLAETARYIRPILLVQVERTGSEQRDGAHVHALDVKDWLLTAGLDEAEIAIKTADTNDLANPDNQDLLAPTNRVRAIITKQALQEGWDCPFAYVLCSLAASRNEKALTQLVGRILRQPQAQKTGLAALDECYVVTHHADTAGVVEAIKSGLEEDGLSDLVREIRIADDRSMGHGPRKVKRRAALARTEIYLPRVLRVDGGEVRELDYEQDVLFELDWSGIDPALLVARIPDNVTSAARQMRRIRLVDSGADRIVADVAEETHERLAFDPAYAVRMVADIVPNPWVAREIVGRLVAGLEKRGFARERLAEVNGLVVEELRQWLADEREQMAERYFRREVASGIIQFRLRADQNDWRMPDESMTYEPEGADQVLGRDGGPLIRSLFAPIYRGDLNEQEREVAVYLDGERSVSWWHRNVARNQYALQGWRRERIYPDFVFAVRPGRQYGDGKRLVVLEMKGEHLQGNPDTEYKRGVLRLLTEAFEMGEVQRVGEMELVGRYGVRVQCDLVLMTEWRTRLPAEFLR